MFGPIERRHLNALEGQLSRYVKVVGKELSDRIVYCLSWYAASQPVREFNSTMKVHMRVKLVSFRKKGHSSVILLVTARLYLIFVVKDSRARGRGWHRTLSGRLCMCIGIEVFMDCLRWRGKWRFRTPMGLKGSGTGTVKKLQGMGFCRNCSVTCIATARDYKSS